MAKVARKQYNDELHDKFIEFMNAPGAPSQSDVAKAMGWSTTTISQYRGRTYQGDVDKLELQITQYIVREKDRAAAPKIKTDFVETSVAARIWEVAYITHMDGEIGVLVGKAGIGKTKGCKRYAELNDDACVYLCANKSWTARVLFRKILESVDGAITGNLSQLFDNAVTKLKGSGRMFIVDQAEYLPHTALEMLRSLHDDSGVSVLLVGLVSLYHNLRQEGGKNEQIYSRVGIYHNLEAPMSAEDAAMLFSAMTGRVAPVGELNKLCRNNARSLQKLTRRGTAIAANNNRELDAECLTEAAKYVMF